jgi:SAM-dependent methyltransferase
MDDLERLKKYKLVWKKKKILQKIYLEWYKKIKSDLRKDAKTLEIGSGIGNFKDFYPDVISSDIKKYPWIDMKVDATKIPFKDNKLGNIVLIDVLHHISNPTKFLDEAYRTLEPGGRILMLEPYPSYFSLIIYQIFHPEPFNFKINPFKDQKNISKHAWDSNQAIAYLLFFRKLKEFNNNYKENFIIKKKEIFSFILYPLSGGFENKSLIPLFLYNFFRFLEFCLMPFKKILAFRCYIIFV